MKKTILILSAKQILFVAVWILWIVSPGIRGAFGRKNKTQIIEHTNRKKGGKRFFPTHGTETDSCRSDDSVVVDPPGQRLLSSLKMIPLGGALGASRRRSTNSLTPPLDDIRNDDDQSSALRYVRVESIQYVIQTLLVLLLAMVSFLCGIRGLTSYPARPAKTKNRRVLFYNSKGVYFDSRTCDVPYGKGKTIDKTIDRRYDDAIIPKWLPSNRENHHKDVPILVRRPKEDYDNDNDACCEDGEDDDNDDDIKLLQKIMTRARKLPQKAGTYSGKFISNHIMINAERTKRNVPPLRRESRMDQIATEHAKLMANERKLSHIDNPIELQDRLLGDENDDDDDREKRRLAFRRLGMNVGRGTRDQTIKEIHKFMMAALAERNNMRDNRFLKMGMGTAMSENGVLYLCQIFGG